jgi:hypothetical protein
MQPGDPYEALAAQWHASQWGAGGVRRNAVYAAMDAAEAVMLRQKARVDGLPRSTPELQRRIEENQLRLNELAYDKHYLEYRSLPEEIDANAVAGMNRRAGIAGLDRRAQVRVAAAQSLVDSANVRVAVAQQELDLYQGRGVGEDALREAQERLKAAKWDADTAEQMLRRARTGE